MTMLFHGDALQDRGAFYYGDGRCSYGGAMTYWSLCRRGLLAHTLDNPRAWCLTDAAKRLLVPHPAAPAAEVENRYAEQEDGLDVDDINALRAHWNVNRALRREFGNNFLAYVRYKARDRNLPPIGRAPGAQNRRPVKLAAEDQGLISLTIRFPSGWRLGFPVE
jgi:hypothetical protein